MKALAEFTKTTLIGGILIVLPIYVSLLLLAKAVQGLLAAVKPITAGIPASVEFREILAILALAAVCFIAGLIMRTGPGLRAKNAVEVTLLEKLPGYTLLRGLAGRVTGQADEPGFAPALAEIEEALVPALIVEKLEDGSLLCWYRRCRRRWPERSTSCRPSGCIRSTCRLPSRSRCSRNGTPAPVTLSGPCKRQSHLTPRRRQPDQVPYQGRRPAPHGANVERVYKSARAKS